MQRESFEKYKRIYQNDETALQLQKYDVVWLQREVNVWNVKIDLFKDSVLNFEMSDKKIQSLA